MKDSEMQQEFQKCIDKIESQNFKLMDQNKQMKQLIKTLTTKLESSTLNIKNSSQLITDLNSEIQQLREKVEIQEEKLQFKPKLTESDIQEIKEKNNIEFLEQKIVDLKSTMEKMTNVQKVEMLEMSMNVIKKNEFISKQRDTILNLEKSVFQQSSNNERNGFSQRDNAKNLTKTLSVTNTCQNYVPHDLQAQNIIYKLDQFKKKNEELKNEIQTLNKIKTSQEKALVSNRDYSLEKRNDLLIDSLKYYKNKNKELNKDLLLEQKFRIQLQNYNAKQMDLTKYKKSYKQVNPYENEQIELSPKYNGDIQNHESANKMVEDLNVMLNTYQVQQDPSMESEIKQGHHRGYKSFDNSNNYYVTNNYIPPLNIAKISPQKKIKNSMSIRDYRNKNPNSSRQNKLANNTSPNMNFRQNSQLRRGPLDHNEYKTIKKSVNTYETLSKTRYDSTGRLQLFV